MNQLPRNDSAVIDFIEPQRRLDQIVLPGSLGETVGELIAEWRQTEKLARYGLLPRNRVLLHGPSGNGKTTLAEAVAAELGVLLGYVRYSELISKWCGETHNKLAGVFAESRKFPCVLFFDEADSLAGSRSESDSSAAREKNLAVNTLLLELDRMDAKTVVIFATNFAQVLDSAMRRRINLTLELPAPTLPDFQRLLSVILARNPLLKRPLRDTENRCGITPAAQSRQPSDHGDRGVTDGIGAESVPRHRPAGAGVRVGGVLRRSRARHALGSADRGLRRAFRPI